jgi:hypothetical protein
MAEPPNALMAINHELRRVEAQAGRRPLDPDDGEAYALISKARDALDELATTLEGRDV